MILPLLHYFFGGLVLKVLSIISTIVNTILLFIFLIYLVIDDGFGIEETLMTFLLIFVLFYGAYFSFKTRKKITQLDSELIDS